MPDNADADQLESVPAREYVNCGAIAGAINALAFITEPNVWPQFLAWLKARDAGHAAPIHDHPEQARNDFRGWYIHHLMQEHDSLASEMS